MPRSLIVRVELYDRPETGVVSEIVILESESLVISPLVLLQVKSTETGVLT